MTVWLWIIAAIALAWPLLLASYVVSTLDQEIERSRSLAESEHTAKFRERSLLDEIVKLQRFVEQQDALIAGLWEKAFGLDYPDKYGSPVLPSHLGVKPDWHVHTGQLLGPPEYLVRYNAYPWKNHAESLYFSNEKAEYPD